MIALEGATLPAESQGRIVPWLFGDVCLDVPGIPLQIGHAATLADNCGVDVGETTWRLSAADLSLWLPSLSLPQVAQVDNEWVLVLGFTAGGTSGTTVQPWTISVSRPYGGTEAAAHDKGATLTFLESRPIWVFAEAPEGLNYPADAIVQARYNDVAQLPPCTFRLDDNRIVPGHRFITAEMDLSKGFGGLSSPRTPSSSAFLGSARRDTPVPSALTPAAGGSGVVGFGDHILRTGSGGASEVAIGGFGVGSFSHEGSSGGQNNILAPLGFESLTPINNPPPPPPSGTTTQPSDTQRATTVAHVVPNAQAALGRLTADIKGLIDTADGRYSGTPEGPLTSPTAVTSALLDLNYGEVDLHDATWLATRTQQSAWGLTWRVIWVGGDFEAFRAQVGLCGLADLWLDDDGWWRYTARPDTPSAIAVSATITDRELIEELKLALIPPSATRLPVTWGAGLQGGTFTLDDVAGQAQFGLVSDRSLSLAYAANENVARFLGKRWLRRWAQQVGTTTIAVAPVLAALTRLDRVYLDTSVLDTYGPKRLPWEIRGTTDRGDSRVLVLVEADPATSLEADSGSVIVSGSSADFVLGYRLVADSGAVVVSGTDAELFLPLVIFAEPGSVIVSGTDADLIPSTPAVEDAPLLLYMNGS